MNSIKKVSAKRTLQLFVAVVVVAAQLAGLTAVNDNVVSASSASPNGPIKRIIVTYGNKTADNEQEVAQTRAIILGQKNRLMNELSKEKGYVKVVKNLTEMPISILEVDADGEKSIRQSKQVSRVNEESYYKPLLSDTIPLIGGTVASGFSDGTSSFTGSGTAVAVMDQGINPNHLMLTNAVVSEACYSSESQTYSDVIVESTCAGGAASSTAPGSATRDCPTGCNHGTQSAAAALGRAVTANSNNLSGVAKNAKLIAIKITVKLKEISGQADVCGDGSGTVSECVLLSNSGFLSGLNRVLQIKNDQLISEEVTAVNYSAGSADGSRQYTDAASCMTDESAAVDSVAITALKNANIAVTISSGNSGNTITSIGQTVFNSNANKVAYPSCLPGAISVGSSRRTDTMAYYSQAGSRTDFVAPGGDLEPTLGDGGIVLPGDGNTSLTSAQGTSFSSPLVAGAWSVMREKSPTITVDTVKRVLQENGVNVTESRPNYTAVTHKRIALAAALADSNDLPKVTSLSVGAGPFTAGNSVNITIVAANATTCNVLGTNNSVTLSNGQGVVSVTATQNSQTYNVQCTDADGYAAQKSVSFVAGASTSDPNAPGQNVGNDGQVLLSLPKTPNTGLGLLMNNPVAVLGLTTLASLGLLFIARRHKQATKRSRR
jgi:hypothetical protein